MMIFILLFVAGSIALAQDDHSRHTHAVAGLGSVDFSTSCNAAAQTLMSRGAALLHSFGYEEARLAFQQAGKADPACAMAHWGVARSWYHPIWPPPTEEELKQGKAAIDRAVGVGVKTEREREYIDALAAFYLSSGDHPTRAKAYAEALADISRRHPKDDEAAIFHALQVIAIGYLDPADKTYAWQNKGVEILNRLLPRHEKHPGVAHYIIHSLDYPSTAELGLKAARAYAKIAPDSPHALHMPSHIFTRLGLWDDSIASNTASAKSAVAQAMRVHGEGSAFDQLHALDYLVYAYMQQGRDKSARAVLAEMAAVQKLDENHFSAAYAFAASPARFALERHDWKAAAALEVRPAWFPWSRFRNIEAVVHYARAIGAALSGDTAQARRSAEELAEIMNASRGMKGYDWTGWVGAQWEAATALIVFAGGEKEKGLRLLRTAAEHEEAVDKHPVTPGALLPVREILADLLLADGAAAASLQEYEAVLKLAPRRFNATTGAAKAAEKLGDRAKARAYAMQLLEIARNAEVSRSELEWARSRLRKP